MNLHIKVNYNCVKRAEQLTENILAMPFMSTKSTIHKNRTLEN